MLLDGDIGLTERVPLELHVNACRECGQRLADLQILRAMPQKPEARSGQRRPILPPGLVGRALEALRPIDVVGRLHHFDVAGRLRHLDEGIRLRGLDVVTRLRHLVVDRIPPRHLAVAAAVPLMVMMAIFVFERGFTVGVEMRQRAPSAPASMRSSPPESTPSSTFSQSAAAPAQSPPAPPPLPVSPPSASASSSLTPPAETPKVAKAPDTKAVGKPAPAAALKPAPARSDPASGSTAPPEPPRKETPSKSGTVARAAPTRPAVTTAAAALAPQIRRGSVDVVGRLQVKNRSEAERDLAALVARAGGTCQNPQRGPAITVVEAAVPHANYGKFAQGVVRLGSWRIEAERSPLPDVVQVTVRLAD